MRIRRSLSKAAVLLWLSTRTASAGAQGAPLETPPPQAFRVEFSSPTCGTGEDFSEEVLKRTERLRPAEPGETALSFLIKLERTPDGARGQLAIREVDGTLSLRDVPGGDCSDVIAAMALIAALTVDPLARSDREVPIAARRRRAPVVAPAPVPAAARRRTPEPAVAAKAQPRSLPLALGVGARVNAHSAVMPAAAVGFGAFVQVSLSDEGPWAPMIRAGAIVARGTEFEARSEASASGTAEFEWITGRVELCPVRLGSERALSLRPCLFVDAGRLRGSGVDVTPERQKAIFWTAAGPELAAEVRLVGPLRAGAEVGILLPFRRDRFFFVPDSTIHDIPWAGVFGGVGLGLHFF